MIEILVAYTHGLYNDHEWWCLRSPEIEETKSARVHMSDTFAYSTHHNFAEFRYIQVLKIYWKSRGKDARAMSLATETIKNFSSPSTLISKNKSLPMKHLLMSHNSKIQITQVLTSP